MFGYKKTEIITDEKKIKSLLTRGVEEVFVREELEKKLKSGKRLKIKLGFDPTGSNIHIGRAVVLRKLREFQDLGHEIIFLVGDFTAKIGDPSDKLEKRPMLSDEKIKENLKDYKRQVGKIVDLSNAKFVFNSHWLKKLKFKEIAELAESFSVAQMSNRRNFKERLDRGDEVSLREFLYPLMQGYDSVHLKADVEIGGFDQLFNVKAGRIIQKHFNQPEQDILTTVMLEGTDGRKMSTSWGNVINIVDEPNDMYGKVMSLKDELIEKYFLLCTNISEEEIESSIKETFKDNPKEAKMKLAREIISIYHSKEEAKKAEKNWTKTFSEGGSPENIQEVCVNEKTKLSEIALQNDLVSSNAEWKRMISQNAVSLNNEKISDINTEARNGILKVGKRRFLKIKI